MYTEASSKYSMCYWDDCVIQQIMSCWAAVGWRLQREMANHKVNVIGREGGLLWMFPFSKPHHIIISSSKSLLGAKPQSHMPQQTPTCLKTDVLVSTTISSFYLLKCVSKDLLWFCCCCSAVKSAGENEVRVWEPNLLVWINHFSSQTCIDWSVIVCDCCS